MALTLPVRFRLELSGVAGALRLSDATLLCGVGLGLSVLTGLVTYNGNVPGDAGAAVLRGAAVLLPIVVGVLISTSSPARRFGRLLVAGGLLSFVASLSASDSEVLYSIGRVATWFTELAVVYLILAFPSGRLREPVDRLLVAMTGVLIATLFVPTVLLSDAYPVPAPWTTCVEGCPGNAFQAVGHEPGWLADGLVPLREMLVSLVFIAVAARIVVRIIHATSPMRRTLTPVLGAALVHVVVVPLAYSVRRADNASDAVLILSWVLAAGLPVLAIGFLVGAVRWRLAIGDALQRLAIKLHGEIGHARLRGLLADALEDPSVEIVYATAEGRWLDADGNVVALPAPGRAVTVVHDADDGRVAIVHDEALVDQRAFVEAVGGFAVMALANQRLAAQVEESLLEVRTSRERILAAADAERRRIERDLHDGAQQRLVALRIKLELASELSSQHRGPGAHQLHQLGEEVGEALEAVRSLAAGVYPALLVDSGLEEALRAIARTSPTPTTVATHGLKRYPLEVEAAVYFCCLEGLQNAAKHAHARSLSIVVVDDTRLRFELCDNGRGFELGTVAPGHGLTNIRDRLAAVGGELVVESSVGRGTRIAGVIPIAQVPAATVVPQPPLGVSSLAGREASTVP